MTLWRWENKSLANSPPSGWANIFATAEGAEDSYCRWQAEWVLLSCFVSNVTFRPLILWTTPCALSKDRPSKISYVILGFEWKTKASLWNSLPKLSGSSPFRLNILTKYIDSTVWSTFPHCCIWLMVIQPVRWHLQLRNSSYSDMMILSVLTSGWKMKRMILIGQKKDAKTFKFDSIMTKKNIFILLLSVRANLGFVTFS